MENQTEKTMQTGFLGLHVGKDPNEKEVTSCI